MIGYAATQHFTKEDVLAARLAHKLVEKMPEDGRSCHDVAAAVGKAIGIEPTRGWYGDVEHSWIVLESGHILDVYAPGRFPMVQLVHARGTTLPEASSYRTMKITIHPRSPETRSRRDD